MFWSQIKRCYSLLEASDKTKFIAITFSMSFLGILDLIGVSLLGILSLMLFDTESSNLIRNLFPSSFLLFFEENLYLLAILISFLFLFKSVTLMIVTKFEFSFLAKAQARISAKIARMFYSQSVDKIAGNSSDKVAHNLTSGIDSAVTVILSSVSVFVADNSLSLGLPLYGPKVSSNVFWILLVTGWSFCTSHGRGQVVSHLYFLSLVMLPTSEFAIT